MGETAVHLSLKMLNCRVRGISRQGRVRRLVVIETKNSYQRCRQQSERRDLEVDHVCVAFLAVVDCIVLRQRLLLVFGVFYGGTFGLPGGKVCSEGSSCRACKGWNVGTLPHWREVVELCFLPQGVDVILPAICASLIHIAHVDVRCEFVFALTGYEL